MVTLSLVQGCITHARDMNVQLTRNVEDLEDVKAVMQVLREVTEALDLIIFFTINAMHRDDICLPCSQVHEQTLDVEEILEPIENVYNMLRQCDVQVAIYRACSYVLTFYVY